VIRSATKVTEEVIESAKQLRVIGRAGVGVDNVDVTAATNRGIVVMNAPGGNTITTAEHAIALLISLARHIPQATASMKAGKWEKKKLTGKELHNRTLGVLGLGNVGRIVADRARGLAMKVIAHDPFISESAASKLDLELVSFDDLLARSDIVTVHVPKTKDTIGLLDAEAFARFKPGALLVNAARGGIVDEDALLAALEAGQVGGAALDVYVEEPPPADHPLIAHDRVICTPHLGAATDQAQINVAVAVAEQVRDFLLHGIVGNALNVPSISRELYEEVRPYISLGEKLRAFSRADLRRVDRADRDRVLRRGGRDQRRSDHGGGVEGTARIRDRSGQHGECSRARAAARHQGDRVQVQPFAGLRQRDHDARRRVPGPVDRGRDLPRWTASHRAHRRFHAGGDSRRPDALHPEP
jgi:D-3-phosphoglycerate dehydrogenase